MQELQQSLQVSGQGMQEVQREPAWWEDKQNKGGNTGNSGSSKMFNYCGLKGDIESQCFKKNPNEAPEWWKNKNTKTESADIICQSCNRRSRVRRVVGCKVWHPGNTAPGRCVDLRHGSQHSCDVECQGREECA